MADFDKEFKKVWATLNELAEDRKRRDAEFKRRNAEEAKWRAEAKAEAKRRNEEREEEEKRREAKREAEAKRRNEEREEEEKRREAKREAEAKRRNEEWEAEAKRRNEEREAEAKRRDEEFARRMAAREEADEKRKAEFDREMRAISQNIGGFTNTFGAALEDEFLEALQEVKRIGDISLDDVRRVKNRFEYDIAGFNGDYVVVGEIKHKMDRAEVVHFAEERLPHFARDFPGEAKGRKILGMVGGGHITARARKEAEKRGLIILRLRNKKLIAENESGARPIAQV